MSADVEYPNSHNSTIPIQCSATNLIPDLTIFIPDTRTIYIYDLSVPFEPNIDKMHDYKTNKYCPLVSDIENNNFKVHFNAIEIGARGFISNENSKRLQQMHSNFNIPESFKSFKNKISKLAIVSSFVIFHAKNQPSWENLPTLNPI